MYKRILVAVDGSLTSNAALDEAIRIARESQGELRLVHVLNTVTFNMEGDFYSLPDWMAAMREGAEAILTDAVTRARHAGVTCEGKLLEIDTMGCRAAEMIVDKGKDWPADVIVIGTHGRNGIHRLLMGSVAEGVLHMATVPVLLIRKNGGGSN